MLRGVTTSRLPSALRLKCPQRAEVGVYSNLTGVTLVNDFIRNRRGSYCNGEEMVRAHSRP
jgi:hypothetical protein